MRYVLLVVGLMLATAAGAQDDPADADCQAEPTQLCVLEMAVRATRSAVASGASFHPVPPFERIVEAASRAGHLDLALSLADDLDKGAGMGIAELLRAAAWADRLDDVAPLLARLGQSEGHYAYAIAPIYAAQGREADLAALIDRAVWKPSADQVKAWRVEGELRAGRPEIAVRMLRQMLDGERAGVVDLLVRDLRGNYNIGLAHPVARFIGDNSYELEQKARMALATADLELARSLVEPLAEISASSRSEVQRWVAVALAASGDWQQAVSLAREIEPRMVPHTLAWIAEEAREPQVLPIARNALAGVTDAAQREWVTQTLIRALVLTDNWTAAQKYIESSPGDTQRRERLTAAAWALALAGRHSDALVTARLIGDPGSRAWAIWLVAWNFERQPM